MSEPEAKDHSPPGGADTPKEEEEVDPELLKEVEARAKEVSANCKKEMDAKLEHLQKTLKDTMENTNVKMRDVSERYQSHRQSQITTTQTDVLRVNKMMRDVARELGQDWKPVFRTLMAEFDDASVEAEIVKIEQQKPFIQPYKSLTTWKDSSGADFQPFAMVAALNGAGRGELGEKVMAILGDNEIDSLYSMASFGTGIKSGTAAHGTDEGKADPEAAGPGEDGATENGARARPGRPSGVVADGFTPVKGFLGDTVLLRVARRLEGEWRPLGEALGVPANELDDIVETTGAVSSQGAFKVLWWWRNGLEVSDGAITKNHVSILKGALKKLGQPQVAKELD